MRQACAFTLHAQGIAGNLQLPGQPESRRQGIGDIAKRALDGFS